MEMKYTITQSRLLYVMTIDDRKHNGLVKVGEVFVDNDVAETGDTQLYNKAVREILDKRSYMQGISTYRLEHVECTTYAQNTRCYKADDVYRTLHKMGIPSKTLDKINREAVDVWFACFVAEVKEAIQKIKNGQGAGYSEIKFRPEQEKAITDTVNYFSKEFKEEKKGKNFLWNAKMRFGKTLCSLEVARRMNYKSTLIITHRPVVDKGWHEDFQKIFGKDDTYEYATRMMEDQDSKGDFSQLTKLVDAGKKRMIFFVSMQYLRLSTLVGGKNNDPLKKAIMKYDWDFVMVDEAHEGIEAAAGIRVMAQLKKDSTRILSLSGTPFNLLDKYEEGEIYTWDYVMEQRAKQEWDDKHFGDPNPYADLPRMQILTFTLPKMLRDQAIENNETFRFHEFFRIWTEEDKDTIQDLMENETNPIKRAELKQRLDGIQIDHFIHEAAVNRFLYKLVEDSDTSQYPFSTDEFREHFRHTFWLLPGVKEAAALEQLLLAHNVFGTQRGMFKVINVAGDGNIEDKNGKALKEVENHIHGNKQENITKKEYTITLSCGKLTTGVSVPEWTAVLCMKGSENTPASGYMQTIFRVQTHAVLEGRQKSDCYVFDFAPDRALTAVAETAKMAVYAQTEKGKKQMKLAQEKEEQHLEAFIKLCPVLSMDEGEMGKHITAGQIFEKLSNVYIERAVRSGYADNSLYNPEQLMNLTPEQEKALGDVRDLIGSIPALGKPEPININKNGIGNTDADQIKYVYFNTASSLLPPKPMKSDELDEEGRPTTATDGWDDVMIAPSQLFPYLYVSSTRLIDGSWTEFTKPVLWKQWSDQEKNTDEAKKKRDEENKEKRARMSVLRGVSIRIPLLVYGAEINDEGGEEITIDNFASDEIVDDASWEEFMPKGFTKETFNILKDCFDRSIFTGAAKRIRAMVKEADNLSIEDRINKIATIFSYFHNPDKETVLTPWRVVNMHMSDCLGGYCFWNEEFDATYTEENAFGEMVTAARFVDRGEVTKDVFSDYNARILEINSKTGLYPLYMAYSIFKQAKEPAYYQIHLTGTRGHSQNAEQYYRQAGNDLEIWKDVLQDNIFVVCRTPMAASITKRTLAGFRKDVKMNVKCYEHEVEVNDLVAAGIIKSADDGVTKIDKTYYYNKLNSLECDMINVLRAKPELFREDVAHGIDFWHVYNSIPKANNEDINNMKFKAIVGNPPYQIMDGGSKASASPIYQLFVDNAKQMSPSSISLIMPSKWFAGGKGLDEFRESTRIDKRMEYLYDYVNAKDLFPTASIGGGICFFLWRSNYDGKCKFTNVLAGHSSTKARFLDQYDVIVRYNEAINIINTALPEGTKTIADIMLSRNPFGPSSNVRGEELPSDGMLELITSQGSYYVNKNIVTDNKDYINAWKVSISKVTCEHAGEPDKNGQVKVLSSLRTFGPNTICTDSYLIIGKFTNEREANNLRSYLATKFARFLLLMAVSSINLSKDKFRFVPLQDFSRPWTDADLYAKYNLTEDEIAYIERVIKPMD